MKERGRKGVADHDADHLGSIADGRKWTLGEALAVLRSQIPGFPASVGEALAGWHSVDRLFSDENKIANWLEYRSRSYDGTDQKAAAAFVMADYAYLFADVTAFLFVQFGLVPDLTPDTVHLRFGPSGASGDGTYAIRGAELRFSANEGTAKSAYPPDWATLCTRYRECTEAHVLPLVHQLSQRSGLSQSAFWRLLADAIALAFLQAGERLSRSGFATSSALAILKEDGSPLCNRQTGFVSLSLEPGNGASPLTRQFRVRGGCCRYYTVTGGSLCVTCVLRNPTERDHDLLRTIAPTERS